MIRRRTGRPAGPRTAAIIPAAGSGRRLGGPTPKQFLSIRDVSILARTLRIFESSPLIHEICLVVPRGLEKRCRQDLVVIQALKKVIHIVAGGKTRQDSVYRGLQNISPAVTRIVVHDGVRPFITPDLLARTIRGCRGKVGAVAAVPLKDTPKRIDAKGMILSTPDRDRLYAAQTPQVFPKKILMEAYRKAYTDGISGTDDSSLVERLGYSVRIVEGSYDNIKITTAEDFRLAEAILSRRSMGS